MVGKKSLFKVDKSAFSPEEIAKTKVSRIKKKKITLDQLLAAAKDLGVSIYIPTSEEDRDKQEQSISKLGFNTLDDIQNTSSINIFHTLKGYLHHRHTISGTIFGPGEIVFELKDSDLFTSLLKQDQMVTAALRDTTQYTSNNRAFVITEGRGRDMFSKFTKTEVSPSYFDKGTSSSNIGIEAAGYRQHSNIF